MPEDKPRYIPMQHDHSQVMQVISPTRLALYVLALVFELSFVAYIVWQASVRFILIYFSGRVF